MDLFIKISFWLLFLGCFQPENAQISKSNGSIKKAIQVQQTTFYVDVRSASEFAAGSVKGAVNIPLDQVASNINRFKNKKKIVVFCRSGNRSAKAIEILKQNGIQNATNGGSFQDVAASLGQ